jgi:hypothetical protein
MPALLAMWVMGRGSTDWAMSMSEGTGERIFNEEEEEEEEAIRNTTREKSSSFDDRNGCKNPNEMSHSQKGKGGDFLRK